MLTEMRALEAPGFKACRTTLFECLAPPFSGVVGSGRWCGVNVGSRVVQAGFTDT